MRKKSIICILSTVASGNLLAGPILLSSQELIFENKDCQITNTCDLVNFKILVEDTKTYIEGSESLGTRMHASFQTLKISDLVKYAFVQKIRGCHFNSDIDGNKSVDYIYPTYMGKEHKNFKFPDWAIDSIDSDPIYNSYLPSKKHHTRLDLYRTGKSLNDFSEKNESYFYKKKFIVPQLYVSDRPGTAFVLGNKAKNVSLEFEICIYKTKDIPTELAPDDFSFATPIACHYWRSSHIYNRDLKKFEAKKKLDSICL